MLDLNFLDRLIAKKPHLDVLGATEESEIVDHYIKKSRPLKLLGMSDSWQTHQWTLAYFKERMGHLKFPVKRMNPELETEDEKTVSLAEFVNYIITRDDNDQSQPYYLNTTFGPTAEMLNDYNLPDYFKCAFNNFREMEEQDPFSWIYLAPKYSMTPLHVDVIHSSAWNLVISGKKLWLFYPEDQTRYLYGGRVNAFSPNFEKYGLYRRADPIVCVQNPGETVFTPSGWYHAVFNLEAGVSLTENFVNQYNIEKVKAYCDAVGIPTDDLYKKFNSKGSSSFDFYRQQ